MHDNIREKMSKSVTRHRQVEHMIGKTEKDAYGPELKGP